MYANGPSTKNYDNGPKYPEVAGPKLSTSGMQRQLEDVYRRANSLVARLEYLNFRLNTSTNHPTDVGVLPERDMPEMVNMPMVLHGTLDVVDKVMSEIENKLF